MKYKNLDLGQVEAIVNKLGGMEGMKRFLSGVTMVNFKVWKTIRLGTCENRLAFKDGFVKSESKLCGWAEQVILEQPGSFIGTISREINLVKLSKADLGLEENVTDDKVIAEALKLDLELCSEEVGPQLRMQYKNQPEGERLRIAMKRIKAEGYSPHMFEVARDGNGFWLGSDSTNQQSSGHCLYGKYYYIFCIKKK